jgi:hypothetical protein
MKDADEDLPALVEARRGYSKTDLSASIYSLRLESKG